MTTDELAARMDDQFKRINKQFDEMGDQFQGLKQQFNNLDTKVAEGFKGSKIRDEELRDLVTLGFEARDVLRDEMHRRFDDADQKHDQQITLLQDAVHHLADNKTR